MKLHSPTRSLQSITSKSSLALLAWVLRLVTILLSQASSSTQWAVTVTTEPDSESEPESSKFFKFKFHWHVTWMIWMPVHSKERMEGSFLPSESSGFLPLYYPHSGWQTIRVMIRHLNKKLWGNLNLNLKSSSEPESFLPFHRNPVASIMPVSRFLYFMKPYEVLANPALWAR